MVITLSGVTGSGKSYFKKEIQKLLNLSNQVIYTTRKKRNGEKNGVDKIFVTDKEFEKLKNDGKIIIAFEYLENKYGYDSEKIRSNENSIIELHYNTIYEFKKHANKSLSIYIIPRDINIAKQKLKERKLDKKHEELRLQEIEEQAKEFKRNKDLQKQFDYVLYNDYNQDSKNKLLYIIKNHI